MNLSSSSTVTNPVSSNPLPFPPQLAGMNPSKVRILIPTSTTISAPTTASLVTPPGQATTTTNVAMNPILSVESIQQIDIVEASGADVLHSNTTEEEDDDAFMIDDIPNILDDVDNTSIQMEDMQSQTDHSVQLHTTTSTATTTANVVSDPSLNIPNTIQATFPSSSSAIEKPQQQLRRSSSLSATTNSNNNVPPQGSSSNSSSTGSIVDKEKVGRWTEQEHTLFLEGLRTHGKQWKVIANMIGTRTVVQVRTHAQKYFQKIDRNSGGSGNGVVVSTVVSSSTNNSTDATDTTVVPTVTVSSSSNTSTPSKLKVGVTGIDATLLSPNSTIISTSIQQQRSNGFVRQTKRKSLPSSLPSRVNNKKSRTTTGGSHKMKKRLSMQNNGSVRGNTTTTAPNEREIISSHSNYISKSSSSTGSDENWSTISPDNVIWDRIDFSHLSEYGNSKDTLTTSSSTYSDNSDQYHEETNPGTFDLLTDDPLEWLIETDCTQKYLPESSLPLFPFHSITSSGPSDQHEYEDFVDRDVRTDIEMANEEEDEPNVIPSIGCCVTSSSNTSNGNTVIDIDNESLRMVDPNVTVQSLFLSSNDDVDNVYIPSTTTVAEQ